MLVLLCFWDRQMGWVIFVLSVLFPLLFYPSILWHLSFIFCLYRLFLIFLSLVLLFLLCSFFIFMYLGCKVMGSTHRRPAAYVQGSLWHCTRNYYQYWGHTLSFWQYRWENQTGKLTEKKKNRIENKKENMISMSLIVHIDIYIYLPS